MEDKKVRRVMDLVEKKARRRIRRFIKTNEHQPRTYLLSGTLTQQGIFEYRVKHGAESLFFKLSKGNRLIRQETV